MILENYKILQESGVDRFAVIDFSEFGKTKELLNNKEKLQDYLDYLHIQDIKKKNEKSFSLKDVKEELGL